MGTLDPQYDQAPVAVVGRPGEQQWQMQGRLSGLSDEEVGYTAPTYQYTGRRGGVKVINPNTRAMPGRGQNSDLIQQRLNDTQSRFDDRYALQQREQDLKEKEFDLHNQIHAHSLADATAVNDQTSGFLNSLDSISQDQTSPRGSKAFLAKALAIAGQYPAAINKNPRLAQMVDQYDRDFKAMNGNPDEVYMLSELGQIDPSQPGVASYVRTLPGKYIGAVGNKAVMKIYDDTLKAVYGNQPELAQPAGTDVMRQTVTGPGGSLVVQPTAINQQKQAALQAKAMQTQLSQAQRTYDSAVALRAKMKEGSDPDVIKLLDSHITEAKANLEGFKSQFSQPSQQSEGDRPPDTTQQEAPKLNPLTDEIAASARAAISSGKDPDAVRKRLQEKGFDPSGL